MFSPCSMGNCLRNELIPGTIDNKILIFLCCNSIRTLFTEKDLLTIRSAKVTAKETTAATYQFQTGSPPFRGASAKHKVEQFGVFTNI